jgi:hypothetical protein
VEKQSIKRFSLLPSVELTPSPPERLDPTPFLIPFAPVPDSDSSSPTRPLSERLSLLPSVEEPAPDDQLASWPFYAPLKARQRKTCLLLGVTLALLVGVWLLLLYCVH